MSSLCVNHVERLMLTLDEPRPNLHTSMRSLRGSISLTHRGTGQELGPMKLGENS